MRLRIWLRFLLVPCFLCPISAFQSQSSTRAIYPPPQLSPSPPLTRPFFFYIVPVRLGARLKRLPSHRPFSSFSETPSEPRGYSPPNFTSRATSFPLRRGFSLLPWILSSLHHERRALDGDFSCSFCSRRSPASSELLVPETHAEILSTPPFMRGLRRHTLGRETAPIHSVSAFPGSFLAAKEPTCNVLQ